MTPLETDDKKAISVGLNRLLSAQLDLQIDGFNLDPLELEGDELMDFIRWNILALENELHEALSETGWKPWAASQHINREAFAKELVDALHFFANLCLAADISGQDLVEMYNSKRERNKERQDEGYDGVDGKCFNCKRDYKETRCTPTTETEHGYCIEWEA